MPRLTTLHLVISALTLIAGNPPAQAQTITIPDIAPPDSDLGRPTSGGSGPASEVPDGGTLLEPIGGASDDDFPLSGGGDSEEASGGLFSGFDAVREFGSKSGIRQFSSFTEFGFTVLQVISTLIAILALVVLIYGGVTYIISLGDEKKTAQAKHIILYAIIGLIVFGLSALVVNIVINLISEAPAAGAPGGGRTGE